MKVPACDGEGLLERLNANGTTNAVDAIAAAIGLLKDD
jgi:hypothetical protein